MIDVFVEVIVPVLIVAALGGWLGDRFGVAVVPLSQLTFFLFSPALVFDALATVELSGQDTARVAAAGALAWIVAAAVSLGVATALRYDPRQRSAVALVAVMANGGNMGLPVALLAFGQRGLEIAVVLFVVTVMLSSTGGIVLASLAGGTSFRRAWAAPLRVPSVWAAVAGLIVGFAEIELPIAIEAAATTLGGAAIPVMLTVLGLHMRRPVPGSVGPGLGVAVTLRLGVGPLIAWLATVVVGIDGVAQKTAVVLGGMPTAVITTIYATQYEARPAFVTRAVIVSTLLSVVTLTVLVAALR